MRYYPATDTWNTMSTDGAPSSREFHAAEWTGAAMLIWGGYENIHFAAEGGSYDPVADAWTPMSEVGAPTPREKFAWVWSGTRLIVWGGDDQEGFAISGGAYDPTNHTWSPISTQDAPEGRRDAKAVWTGSELVVWGGWRNPYEYVGTGGRYDPATDMWKPMATVGAIAPRYEHTATWTGREIVIWGGVAVAAFDGGGRYVIPSAIDSDGDTVPDSCDNCAMVWSPNQSDKDADGEGDVCDLDDGAIWEGRPDKTSISWQRESGFTAWNIYLGDLGTLKSTELYTQPEGSNSLADRHCGVMTTTVSDLVLPGPGEASFSLVTGVSGGVEGSLGTNASGVPRANANPCP